jgi:hypothetical protein
MLSLIPLRLKTLRPRVLLRNAAELVLLAAALLPAQALIAQEPAPAAKSTHQQPGSAAKASAAKARSRNAIVAPAPPPAPTGADTAAKLPPALAWPANEHPQQAHVTWDSHGLRIAASNSSLNQILHEVSTDTGVKVEGFGKDQRIFGTYGPGPAREVLSRLLDGSGYNVLMVGGMGDAPPSRIVLSTASPSGPPPPPGMQNRQNDEDVEVEEPQPEEQPQPPPPVPQETPQPTPIRNPFGDMQHMPGPSMTQPVSPDQQQTNPQQ